MSDKKKKNRISDNPSVSEMAQMIPLARLMGSAAGALGALGINRDAMTKFSNATDELLASAEILDMPDRFNTAFGKSGWIATGSFSSDIMRKAVELFEDGKPEEAERAILDWFTEDNLRLFAITRARRFHKARQRDDQLEEALLLFNEERYWAAVPLILIACDGFASDVSGISPFEKNADLTCFDSITGHDTSLPALMKLFVQGVRKSTDEELLIPKRHGILHGRSLGYANRVVCAKAWLLMVALVDWAIDKSSEQERKEAWERKQTTNFADVLANSRKIREDRKIIDAFEPSEQVGPLADELDEDSAEFALREFLEGWKARNYGRMASRVVNLTQKSQNKMAGEMRDTADLVELQDYEVTRFRHANVARCEAVVRVSAKTLTKEVEGLFDMALLRFNSDGDVAMPLDPDGKWVVQQKCIYDVMHEKFAEPD